MKLLIIGGTQFLGRHFVETALAHGHKVTLFNRGQTNPGLYPEVEKLVGDRAACRCGCRRNTSTFSGWMWRRRLLLGWRSGR